MIFRFLLALLFPASVFAFEPDTIYYKADVIVKGSVFSSKKIQTLENGKTRCSIDIRVIQVGKGGRIPTSAFSTPNPGDTIRNLEYDLTYEVEILQDSNDYIIPLVYDTSDHTFKVYDDYLDRFSRALMTLDKCCEKYLGITDSGEIHQFVMTQTGNITCRSEFRADSTLLSTKESWYRRANYLSVTKMYDSTGVLEYKSRFKMRIKGCNWVIDYWTFRENGKRCLHRHHHRHHIRGCSWARIRRFYHRIFGGGAVY